MAQGATLPPEQPLTALPQLGNVLLGESIQGASQRGLLRKALTAPGTSQGQIRANSRVGLADGTTTGQDTDEHIHQFVWGIVINSFHR